MGSVSDAVSNGVPPRAGDGVYVALGSNLAWRGLEPARVLAEAAASLDAAGLRVIARSGLWRSPAWPAGSAAPDYANAVAQIDAGEASPQAALERLQRIERDYGRVRSIADRWAPRTLDLDLLDFAGMVIDTPTLTLPHPRIALRGFVLAPLLEIAPDWRRPGDGAAGHALLAALGDHGAWRDAAGWGLKRSRAPIARR